MLQQLIIMMIILGSTYSVEGAAALAGDVRHGQETVGKEHMSEQAKERHYIEKLEKQFDASGSSKVLSWQQWFDDQLEALERSTITRQEALYNAQIALKRLKQLGMSKKELKEFRKRLKNISLSKE